MTALKYLLLTITFLTSFQMNCSYLITRNILQKNVISLQRHSKKRLFSTLSNNENNENNEVAQNQQKGHELRRKEINKQLHKFNIPNIDQFESAVQSSIEGTYNHDTAFQFGSSAIKTYKTYIQSKHEEDIEVSALRTARQIEFLIKKHKSRTAEWVRHNDFTSQEQQSHETSEKNKRFPIRLVLDNVRSAYNVGSIFRTADACNVSEIITTGITPHPGKMFFISQVINFCYLS